MKTLSFLIVCTYLIICGCNNKKNETAVSTATTSSSSTEKNISLPTGSTDGVYTEGGKSYSGQVETITSQVDKSFNVVCKGDIINELSFFFNNEKAARKGGSFKKGSLVPIDDYEIGIIYGIGYRSKGSPDGTVTVTRTGSKNVIEFTDMVLTADGKNVTISGKIPF